MKLDKLKYWLIPAFWIVVTCLMIGQDLLVYSLDEKPVSWPHILIMKTKWLLYIPISFMVFWLAKKIPLVQPKLFRKLVLHFCISLVVSSIAVFFNSLIVALLAKYFLNQNIGALFFLKRVFSFSFFNEFINYWLLLAVYKGINFYQDYQLSQTEKARLEKQLSDTKLSALKIQLQPHFLFNTHHNIIGLMQKGDTEKATKMLIKLSDLLRLSLKENNEDLVKLKNEIHLLELYLDILKIRFEDRLACKILIDNSLQEAFVPPMLLQPIVENAIKYGVEPFSKQGEIEISAKNTETQLMLSVKDNGIETFSDFKFGIGLMNTQERLKNLFGEETSINILSNAPERGVCVTITLPLLK
ncbi:sensor histidine kinase [Emticicia aquatilis]|uniref:sensor histidine kinase n=1 Tax=Emticicia aquatilis TaxID=1537369 RepID=UPI001669B9A0|nr:histidine kinase [Emticicia aquatilis]